MGLMMGLILGLVMGILRDSYGAQFNPSHRQSPTYRISYPWLNIQTLMRLTGYVAAVVSTVYIHSSILITLLHPLIVSYHPLTPTLRLLSPSYIHSSTLNTRLHPLIFYYHPPTPTHRLLSPSYTHSSSLITRLHPLIVSYHPLTPPIVPTSSSSFADTIVLCIHGIQ